MYKYVCLECGHEFDEPNVYEERHGFSHGPFERWSVCPECGSPGYEPAFICPRCDRTVGEETDVGVLHGTRLCLDCINELEELADTDSFERPPVMSSFQLIVLTQEERDAVIAALRHCACIYEANPEGILMATHDPSEKTDAEKRFESFVLEAVLATQVVPGQWRSLIAHALVWFTNRYGMPDSPQDVMLRHCAQLLDPRSHMPWPTAYSVARSVDPADEESVDTKRMLTKHRLRSINDELIIRGSEDLNAAVCLQIGQDVYSLPARFVRVEYSGE